MQLPVMPPVSPMLAKWSPQSRWTRRMNPMGRIPLHLLSRFGDQVELGSRNVRPLDPLLPRAGRRDQAELPHRCVIDGEIIIATDHG